MVRSTDIVDLEEALTKTGPELFKELFRIYPVAEPEDYFKAGQWRNDVMKADLQLLESHRRECGAPDVPDLDDIKMPFDLPQQISGLGVHAGLVAPRVGPVGLGATPSPAVSAAGSAPVVEIRLIALFVAKWKLEPASAKKALATLTPTHRRFVIQNFKTEKTAEAASTELEEFIAKCEADKSWDAGAAAAKAPAAATNGAGPAAAAGAVAVKAPTLTPRPMLTPRAVGPMLTPGLKRPMLTPSAGANPAWQQNKRPMLSPAGFRPPAMMARPAWNGW